MCGLYAKAAVQESIGKTRTEAGFGIPKTKLLELLPAEMDNSIIELLDLAGYLTFREYDGLDDFYVYHTKMMSPDGSDFRYAEDVRVKNKIIRETRKEGLLLLNDDIDLEDVQGELETRAKFMFVPLQRMIDAKEISSAQIIVPEGQAQTILEDETMRVKIRYVSRGYQNGAEGIGLFRSEFLYLESETYPTEDEQFEVYKKVAETMAGKRVIIRTLDIGADKQADYFELAKEENPAMGVRAIRICLTRPEIFIRLKPQKIKT